MINIRAITTTAIIALMTLIGVAPASAGGRDGDTRARLGLGFHAATTGFGLELGVPLGNLFAVRAGVSYMPGFKFTSNVTGQVSYMGFSKDFDMDITGNLERVQGSVIVNVYPLLDRAPFFIAAGAYFGGSKILGLHGHTDALRGYEGFLELGGFELPVDKDGNASGALKVNGFRPYLGIGFGHPAPRKRINFGVEIGAQFMGTMTPYAGGEKLTELLRDHYDDWQRWIDHFKVYPVVKFTITGKLL